MPILASAAPVSVALLRRRVWPATLGSGFFLTGYLAILLADENGANSAWHLMWLTGLAVLGLGVIPRAAPGSWWERRYGRPSLRLNVAASAPTVGLVAAFVTPYLYPYQEAGGRLGPPEALLVVQSYVLAVLVVGALVAPVVGVVFGRLPTTIDGDPSPC